MNDPASVPQSVRPRLTTEKVTNFMEKEWGASEVIVLGDPVNAIWVYYRGCHATKSDAVARYREVESSLIRFMMEHGDYDERFRDGQILLQLEWHDQRCAPRWPFQTEPRPYRKGEICHVGDTIYSHQGSQYTICVDQGDGKYHLDLQELPGFEDLDKRFQGRGGILACSCFSDRARFDERTKHAAELLSQQYEDEYWDAVAAFLVEWHERIAAKARMAEVLRGAGFSDDQISDAELGDESVPIEPIS